MTEPAAPTSPARDHTERSVIIRPWPKVVFLYPTLICALVCWFAQMLGGSEVVTVAETADGAVRSVHPIGSRALGNTFLAVFFLNILVFSFDFSRIKSITLIVVVAAVLLALGWADATWGIAGGINDVLGGIDARMSTQFYGLTAGFLLIVFLIVLVNTDRKSGG